MSRCEPPRPSPDGIFCRDRRMVITEAAAVAWRPRKGHLCRHMTLAEAAAWDDAHARGDRETLLAIKEHCLGKRPGVLVKEPR